MGSDLDRIVGLELGADDYVGKPFNPRELIARIKAVRRVVTWVSNLAFFCYSYGTRCIRCGAPGWLGERLNWNQ